MISDAQIEEIIDRNRIEDVIGEYVKLKRSGAGYVGICPFHQDKNPSMYVFTDRQLFKCFSCNVAGNVVHFVMRYNKISYYEALKLLADRAGIRVDETTRSDPKAELRKKIGEANKEAAKFFFSKLKENQEPQKYLKGRGITGECLTKFGFGYAPDSWNELFNHLKQKGFTEDIIEKAGLSTQSKNGIIDKFRNRVMIPIFDINGAVVAFGGRVLDDSKPKYLNTAETEFFTKGNLLYGMNFAKRAQLKQRVILVEGYMDCIALQNRGIDNSVASLGTSLTQNQAKLIKRYFDEAVICYDSDGPGITAALRAIGILKEAGVRVKVMNVPDGKDPDEFLRQHSPEDFLKAADEADSAVEFRIKTLEKQYPLDKPDRKVIFMNESVKILAAIEDKTERDIYIEWFSKRFSVTKDSLVYDVNREAAAQKLQNQKTEERNIRIAEQKRQTETKQSGDRPENDALEETETKKQIEAFYGGKKAGTLLFKYEITLLVLFSGDVRCFTRYDDTVNEEFFGFEVTKKLFTKLKEAEGNGSGGFNTLLENSDVDTASELVESEKETELTGDVFAACSELIRKIKILKTDIEIEEMKQKLKSSDISGEERAEYMKKVTILIGEKRKM